MQSIRWNGQPITVPGIYSGIPLADYHRGDICDGPSVSSSGLRKLWMTSAAHFWDGSPLNPDRDDSDDEDIKAHFVMGRAAHHLLLREPSFKAEFIIRPEKIDGVAWHGNRKECKAWLTEHRRKGLTVLLPTQVDAVKGMALRLGQNNLYQAGILNGDIERSMFAKDAETGLWIKVRPDIIPNDSGDYADLKSTTSVLYLDLQKTLNDFGYHMQGALVFEVARLLGLETSSFSLVFQEKTRPYCVRVETLIDADLALGAKQNRYCIDTIAQCLADNHWPGPGDDRDDAENIQLSDWARKRIEDRLKFTMREAA